jgi:hypothetical protein
MTVMVKRILLSSTAEFGTCSEARRVSLELLSATATHNRFLMRLFLKLLEHQNNKSGERFNACRFCFALFDKDFSVCFAEFVPNVRQPGNNYNETIFIFEQAEFKRRLPRKLVAAGFDLARLSDIRIPKIIVTIKNPTVFYR